MRVVLYARVSTRDKGQDVENQLSQLREFCGRQGWNVTREYTDQVSGKTANRPQFKELFAAASRCEFDMVVFWSLDRFSREGVLETLQHLQLLNSHGVNWRSFTEQYLDSCGAFRDAVLSILAVIAKQERVRLSERTIAGLEKARREGRVGGRPRVIVNRARVKKLHDQGMSYAGIADKLKLKKTTVHRIVRDLPAA